MKLNHAVVAGTFDHLHAGHHQLLTTALDRAKHISCGLSLTPFTPKQLPTLIQSFDARHQQLTSFLSHHSSHWSLFSLPSPLAPADHSPHFDSIITSQETASAVSAINRRRQQNHLKPLTTITTNLLKASDQQPLSSTRIRQGQTNRQGFAYHQIFPPHQPLTLPSLNRHHFRRPFDTLLTGSQSHLGWAGLKAKKILRRQPPLFTIAVGDIATISLLQQKINLDLAIIDLKTRRQPLFNNLAKLGLNSQPHHLAENPPGHITPSLVTSIQQSLHSLLHQPSPQSVQSIQSILVKGEEDLAVIPAILLAPLTTAIFYGQPNQGLVYISVTEKSKQKALRLLQKFI